ncbi:MAG: hypothetical protein J1F20_05560 [Muribaculaceae bacterium]|nr:hypothetical protein [Muribaculaceae bacterium]
MTKLFTLTLAALMCCGASYAGVNHLTDSRSEKAQTPRAVTCKAKPGRTLEALENGSLIRKAKAAATDNHGIITVPSGTPATYQKSCDGYFMFLGSWLEPYKAGAIQATIYEDGNEVYIYDILNKAPFGSYVKGYKLGDQIEIPLPQTLAYEEVPGELPLEITLNVLKLGEFIDEDGELAYSYFPAESFTSIRYIQDENGSWVLELPGEPATGDDPREYSLGIVDQAYGDWLGYCDFSQTYTLFKDTAVSIPANCTTEIYNCVSGDSGYEVEVAIDGNDMYIKGLCNYGTLRNLAIKGSIEGDKVVFPQKQFLGIFEFDDDVYYIYTMCGYRNPDYQEWNAFSPEYLLTDADYVFDYDAEAHSLTRTDPDLYLLFNSGTETLNYVDAFSDLKILQNASYSGTPANPYALWWTPFLWDYYGYTSFDFELPMTSTTGDLLDISCLYYSVYIDGEIMTFVPDDEEYVYSGLEGPTTLVPYSVNNNWDIYLSTATYHQIGIYQRYIKTAGVQMTYIYDGVTTYSDLVTLDIETGKVTEESGVSKVTNDSKVVSTEYYTITGQKVTTPSDGVYIVRNVHEDGTTTVNKTVVRH